MKQLTQVLFSVCVAAVAGGCASAPSHFYTLNATAQSTDAPAVNCAVIVGPVFIPGSVDRPQFVVEAAPNRVEFDEFNRWAAPLDQSIARVVSTDLGTLLGTPRVASAPMPDFGLAYQVTIRIERFESVRGGEKNSNGEALVDAVWVVRDPAGNHVRSGRTVAREPVQGDSFDALAAAHSRALAKVSSDIGAAIRTEADAM
jgi:uncharacterized protein